MLEARIKVEERQKVKRFLPNDPSAEVEAEDDKVCDILRSLSDIMKTHPFLDPSYCTGHTRA